MITWGISANSHDAALAVFHDNDIVFASHTERFSGLKNDRHLNMDIICYAQRWGYPQQVVWYENPTLKSMRQLSAGQGFKFKQNNIKKYLKKYNITVPIKIINHHHSHAAAGYFTSKFTNATILVADAIGEFNTLTIWTANKNKIKKGIFRI